jgi:hypothetical protein
MDDVAAKGSRFKRKSDTNVVRPGVRRQKSKTSLALMATEKGR